MKLPTEAELLRIFIGESDTHKGRPLYEVLVEEARCRGLAGATVLRGTLGFGASSRIHTAHILRLSEDLPMVVEIVDTPEKIGAFLPDLDALIDEGLVTLERVRVILYRHNGER
jgi:PII-like signaling protein